MVSMFSGCSSLTSLDLSGFDTSNVGLMSSMFYGCTSLESVDLSSFDTANVRIMYGAFRDYSSLESLDLSGFDTSSVFDADEAPCGLYLAHECQSWSQDSGQSIASFRGCGWSC